MDTNISFTGSETVLLAESHLTLRRANQPNLPFEKAYSYGKSTKNQRIEAWWNILTEAQTQEWKRYFAKLEAEGYFDGGESDKSCLQYLYMDMIRSHIHRFIEIHNSHPIRFQRSREHYLPTGQPFLMYYYPESGKNYQEKVNERVLARLEKEVENYDLDEYLPEATYQLYGQFLLEGGYPKVFDYSDPRHKDAYIYLRDRVSQYIADGGQVQLASRPAGAAEWIAANNSHEIETHRGNIIGHQGDTAMHLIGTDDEDEEHSETIKEADVQLLNPEIQDTSCTSNNNSIHMHEVSESSSRRK